MGTGESLRLCRRTSRKPGVRDRLGIALIVLAAAVAAVAALGAERGAASPTSNFAPSAPAALSDKLVPARGALFGVAAQPRYVRSWEAELLLLEAEIGRLYDLDRRYYRWDDEFPGAYERWTVTMRRIPLLSWKALTRDGATVTWRRIASGAYDDRIRARARAFKAFGSPVMLIFDHEPERSRERPADFVAAWRRVVSIFRQAGATNVVWVWNLMAVTFSGGGDRSASSYYPGDSYVDWIAADGYNWYGSELGGQVWRSFRDIFSGFYRWGSARPKPLMIAEFGSLDVLLDPLRRAIWFKEAADTIKSWPRLKGVSYFNGFGWFFDSTPQSLAAYRAVATDPYFNPRTVPQSATS